MMIYFMIGDFILLILMVLVGVLFFGVVLCVIQFCYNLLCVFGVIFGVGVVVLFVEGLFVLIQCFVVCDVYCCIVVMGCIVCVVMIWYMIFCILY